jgi:hypothetical protein
MVKKTLKICLLLVLVSCNGNGIEVKEIGFNKLFETKRTVVVPDTVGFGRVIMKANYKNNDLLYLFDRTVSALFKINLNTNSYKRILRNGIGPNELQSTKNISFSDSNTIFWGNMYSASLNEVDLNGNLIRIRKLPALSAGFNSQIFEGKHYFKQYDNDSYQIIDDEGKEYVKTPSLFQKFPTKTNPGFYLLGNKLYYMLAYEAVVHTLDLKTKKHERIELKLPIEQNFFKSKYNQKIDKKNAKLIESQSLKIVTFIPFLNNNDEQYFLLYCFRANVGTWLFILNEKLAPVYNVTDFSYDVSYLTSYKSRILLHNYDRDTGESTFSEIQIKGGRGVSNE